MKVFAKNKVDDYIYKILLGDAVIVENGNLSKSISKTLQNIRKVCNLVLGKDNGKRTVFIMLNPPSVVKRGNLRFGGSVFSCLWNDERYVRVVKDEKITESTLEQ